MKKTIKDIAKACNVSPTLVSRITNNDPDLKCKQETIDKVLKEIEKSEYVPNQHARILASGVRTKIRKISIGYVTFKGPITAVNSYFDTIAEGLKTILDEENCEIHRYYVDDLYIKYKNKESISNSLLDGLIIFGSLPQDLLNYLSHQAKYISCIYGDILPNCDFVGTDTNTSINPMIDLIKDYGYTEIGFLYGSDEKRINKIKKYILSVGLNINDDYCLFGNNTTDYTYDVINKKLKIVKPPKVICCLNDEMAIGVVNALIDNGYKVPEDVSVTGHDDVVKASFCKVPLTTVRIYTEEIGRLISDLLLERINYFRRFPVKVTVPCEIVVRNSLKKNS